jgi:hypothetical protein
MSYARKDEGFWTDPELRKIDYTSRYLFDWFFTNPQRHYSGLYFCEMAAIEPQTGIPAKVLEKAIKTLEEHEFIRLCREHSTVFVVNMLKHQCAGEHLNEKQAKGMRKYLNTLHCKCFVNEFIEKNQDLLNGRTPPGDTPLIPLSYPIDTPISRAQSQSQSQSQSKKGGGKASPKAPGGDNGDARPPAPVYSCECFEVSREYLGELREKFAEIPEDYLLHAFLPAMRDWCLDNRHRAEHKSKFESKTGRLRNPRKCFRTWLQKEAPEKIARWQGEHRARAPTELTEPEGILTPDPNCTKCNRGLTAKGLCDCLKPEGQR